MNGVRQLVIVRYGELFLKSKPVRQRCEKILAQNIRESMRELSSAFSLVHERGRVYVLTDDADRVASILTRVFGIVSVSPASEMALAQLESFVRKNSGNLIQGASTFRVTVKRVGEHPFSSQEMAAKLGGVISEKCKVKVNLRSPERTIFVEIRDDRAFVCWDTCRGLGGLPVGMSGRVVALLSGGIDSPVAAWLLMKRGCRADLLHIHPFRLAGEVGRSKVVKLAERLSEYGGVLRLMQVPFYVFQARMSGVPERYELVLFRRFMMRIAEKAAISRHAKAIVVGDSLGQVASQTLDNLYALEDATQLPVFRPLLGFDKEEIVAIAKRIGTYDISTMSYKDCCSIISRHPRTRANLEKVRELESQLDIPNIVEESLDAAETTIIGS